MEVSFWVEKQKNMFKDFASTTDKAKRSIGLHTMHESIEVSMSQCRGNKMPRGVGVKGTTVPRPFTGVWR